MRKVLNTDVFYDDIATQFIADSINSKVLVAQVAGGGAGTDVAFANGDVAVTIQGALAFTTSTGAPASKCLLASGTDYTVGASPNDIHFVTAQTGNTVVVFYTLG